MEINKIIQGDTLDTLRKIESESIDMVITSPPYWGLRNYGVDGQIGLEKTFDEFLKKILEITAEVKRVLKKTGTFWLNFGDCYASAPAGNKSVSEANIGDDGLYVRKMEQCEGAKSFVDTMGRFDKNKYLESSTLANPSYLLNQGRARINNYPEKCMLMQPERLAIKMIDEQGWILRNKIKWAKQVLIKKENRTIGSVMPTSVKDRFNESGEELYFFVKNKKYYSDLNAVRLPNQVLGVTDFREDTHHLGSGFVRTPELYPNSKYRGKFRGNENAESFNSPRARTQRYGKGSEYEQKYGEPWDRFGSKTLKARMNDTKNKDTKSSRTYNIKKLLSEVRLGIKPNTGMDRKKVLEIYGNDLDGSRRSRVRDFIDNKRKLEAPTLGKNLPTVWLIGSEPHNFQREYGVDTDHFATFPQALCEIPIKFGCPKKICKHCGKVV